MKKAVASFLVLGVWSTVIASNAEAITVDRNYRGEICIYVPKAHIPESGSVQLEVYWGAYTGRYLADKNIFGQENSGNNFGVNAGGNVGNDRAGGNAGINIGVNSNTVYSRGRNPNFGIQLQAYGNNVTQIDTNFPVVGFEQQSCKSDTNIQMN